MITNGQFVQGMSVELMNQGLHLENGCHAIQHPKTISNVDIDDHLVCMLPFYKYLLVRHLVCALMKIATLAIDGVSRDAITRFTPSKIGVIDFQPNDLERQ